MTLYQFLQSLPVLFLLPWRHGEGSIAMPNIQSSCLIVLDSWSSLDEMFHSVYSDVQVPNFQNVIDLCAVSAWGWTLLAFIFMHCPFMTCNGHSRCQLKQGPQKGCCSTSSEKLFIYFWKKQKAELGKGTFLQVGKHTARSHPDEGWNPVLSGPSSEQILWEAKAAACLLFSSIINGEVLYLYVRPFNPKAAKCFTNTN